MAFTAITKPTVGEATKKTAFADAVIDNLSDLNGRSSSGGSSIPNAGFDTDTDADGTPDSWTVTDTGGSHTIEDDDNTEQARGTSAFQFAYPASSSGGGYIETTDQIDVAAGEWLKIAWKMLGTSATGAKHILRFYWFTWDGSACSTASVDAYTGTFNPTAWTQFYTETIAPTDAKFFKVRFILSDTSATPSGTGSIALDDVRMVDGPAEVFAYSVVSQVVWTAGTWIAPSNQLIWVECVGSGGGAAGGADTYGSGGGEYAAGYFAATSGTAYAFVVPEGGYDSFNGTATTFNSTTVLASGGNRGGTGQGGSGGTGVITIDGGDGMASPGNGGYGGGPWGGFGGNTTVFTGGFPGGGLGADKTGGAGQIKIWFNA